MRGAAALLVVATATARADPPRDPRDAFGFGSAAKAPPPLDCGDGLAFGCSSPTDPLSDTVPYAFATWLPADYLLRLPTADAKHDDVAHYALGANRDDAGPAFGGATGLENRWTIDGAPSDDPRLGGNDTRVPLAFLDGILVTAGGFAARDRVSTGGAIEARLVRGGDHHVVDVRAFVSWTAPARAFPTVPDSFQPRTGSVARGPAVSASIVATGPLGALFGGRAWYALGIAPEVHSSDFTWHAARLVDGNQDGVPDGAPGILATDPISTTATSVTSYFVPAMARAGFDRGAHHLELTAIGHVQTGAFFLLDSTLQAAGVSTVDTIGDGIATYRGTWRDTRVKLQVSWHRAMHTESARDPAAANQPQLLAAYVPKTLVDDPALAAACDDSSPSNPYPKIQLCPVPFGFFASAGAGRLVDRTADRPTFTADVAHRIGNNVVRVGGTAEESRMVTTTRFTGGELDRSLFPGELGQQQFVDPSTTCSADITQPCRVVGASTLSWTTLYSAAYVEDTWTAAPGLVVDGGLRWELMWVGPVLHFSDELAPRFGASWERGIRSLDAVGGGKLRAFASAGRSFAMLPAGLGATLLRGAQSEDTITSPVGVGRVVDTGASLAIARGIAPMTQDELAAGVELAIARTFRARAWLQVRSLARGMDATARGLDNPGRVAGEPVGARDTELVAVELSTSPVARLVLRAGYMFGVTNGNATFAYDPRQGAALYTGDDYVNSTANLYGTLPSSAGHRAYVEAMRRGRIGGVELAVATRLTVASGRPRDVLADGNTGIVQLLPRGSGGRGELISQANVRLAARWRRLDFTLDLFDVLDRRAAVDVEQVYAGGAIDPIVGGSYADLVFLKDSSGAAPVRRTAYGFPTAYQAPFSAALGVHRAF